MAELNKTNETQGEKEENEPSVPNPLSAPPPIPKNEQKPIALIVIGMAGSGKSTLMQRLFTHAHEKQLPTYSVNLDPAVQHVPFGANIDIRDTVNYKEVMKQYGLGPNGGIMTSMNLFATRFDQVMNLVENRAPELRYVFFDTPGQIEVFTWSASGTIMTESIANTMRTALVYVIDTPRTADPVTFMSNMLYACSIMYKAKLPFIIVFNKIDVVSHEFANEWMADFEVFQEAIDNEQDQSYVNGLARSMSLVLDEFYRTISTVGVSAVTGQGLDDFFEAVNKAGEEYDEFYLPELEKRKQARKEQEAQRAAETLSKFEKERAADILSSKGNETVNDDEKREYEELMKAVKAEQ